SCDVKALTDGSLYCGTDATGAGGGSDPFTHPSAGISATTTLLALNGGASTTQLSVTQMAYFGGTATTTIDSAGNVGVATTSPGIFTGGAQAPLTVAGNITGTNFINAGVTGGYQIGGQLLAYASSTNGTTVFGLGAGGNSATTSASAALANTAIGYQALFFATSSNSGSN